MSGALLLAKHVHTCHVFIKYFSILYDRGGFSSLVYACFPVVKLELLLQRDEWWDWIWSLMGLLGSYQCLRTKEQRTGMSLMFMPFNWICSNGLRANNVYKWALHIWGGLLCQSLPLAVSIFIGTQRFVFVACPGCMCISNRTNVDTCPALQLSHIDYLSWPLDTISIFFLIKHVTSFHEVAL